MIWVDYCILGIIAVSALISLFRGFVKELFSLITWVLAFWVSIRFADRVAPLFDSLISAPSARLGLAYVLLFLGTLVTGALLTHALAQLVKRTHLSGTDRAVGILFGMARGGVIVTALVMAGQIFTPVEDDPWWTESTLLPHFVELADWFRGFLPAEWQREMDAASGQPGAPPEQPPEQPPEEVPAEPQPDL